MFVVIAQEAARLGLLIMIACHRISPEAWPGEGLWYDKARGYPEARVKESWSQVATALCAQWNGEGRAHGASTSPRSRAHLLPAVLLTRARRPRVPAVFAADLQNEPHAASWGKNIPGKVRAARPHMASSRALHAWRTRAQPH